MNQKVNDILERNDQIRSDNSNWRNYQEEICQYVIPRKAWINTPKQTGERLKFNFIFDSTAIRSLKIMAAGFHSNLTNPSTKWFNLRTRNLSIMDSKIVQMWFKEVEDIIFGILNSSNFDTTMQEFYLNVGSAGTSAILTQRDPTEVVRFSEIPVEQLAFEEDASGRVNAMYRCFRLTVSQAYEKWGEKAGDAVTKNIKSKPTMMLEFIHYVGPRDRYDNTKIDSINMPYASVWIEKSQKHLIEEGGYRTFPYAVGRFYKDSADPMGYSPAMDVLAEVKLVNIQVKTMLRASMKQADPALILPYKGYILPLNSNPGATNYKEPGSTVEEIKQMPSNGNIPITLEVIQMVQNSIKEAFFVPLFQALSNITKQMTVPEVQRRIAENMVLLGPTVGRFTQDVLDNILIRVFGIAQEDGILPPVPEEIAEQDLDIVYISPLAKAQRESEIYSIQAFLSDVGAISNFKPLALDMVNEDNTIKKIAQIRGIDPELVNSDDQVAVTRKQRMEREMAAQRLNALQQGADIVKVGAEAAKTMKDEKR